MRSQFQSVGFMVAGLILCCFADIYAQSAVHIKGNIKGLHNGKIMFAYELDDVRNQDSVRAYSDIFSKDILVAESVRCTLTNSINRQMRIFLMEKGSSIDISGDISRFYELKILGSKEHEILEKLKKSIYSIPNDRPQTSGNIDLDKELKRKFEAEHKLLKDSVLTKFIKSNNTKVAAAIAIFDAYVTYPNRSKAGENYNLLSPAIKNSYYGQRIKTFADSEVNTSIGSKAIDFSLPDQKGDLFSLKDFSYKYLLLDFWASWCGPCRLENPNLIKAYSTYHHKGFELVGLSMDSFKESWLKAIEEDGLTWKQLNDPKSTNGKTADHYGVKSLPTNFLIDADGKIIARNLRGSALEEMLEKLLK